MQNTYKNIDNRKTIISSPSNFATRNGSSDPELNKRVAQLTRYIVHKANWAAISTISRNEEIKGYPFNNIKTVVDGPHNNSTGVPYFYLPTEDFATLDLEEDNRTTIAFTTDEDGFCHRQGLDVDDARCARVIIVGQAHFPEPGSEEYEFAYKSLILRHPNLKNKPGTHKVTAIAPDDVLLVYGSEELRCSTVPLYFSSKPKHYTLQQLLG
ncbi:protein CREG2-like [Ctenocephalides felis]|uniref:protein CREG2-like n=1 Tax=Ctenocephalides felis TaxID=7515 RepID=UPI000E6E2CE4|nr:protein CREG2-like [Ctenocephalides felis]